MTQPVYDPAVLDKFLDDIAPLGLPVMVGVSAVSAVSYRNAEFLHNEVPGMQVPQDVRRPGCARPAAVPRAEKRASRSRARCSPR